MPAETLIAQLNRFGLVTKPPEQLGGGTALRLKVLRNGRGELVFTRGNKVPSVPEKLTRRGLFSICGKLVGHYPVAGWLRVACRYVKRRAEGGRWDDYVGEEAVSMLAEVIARVEREDPVRGQWLVPKGSAGVVWCDASIIATGVLLEIGGVVAEDAAWLRKKDKYGHINIAELEAVVRGGQSGSEVRAARDRDGNGLCNHLWVGEVNAIGGEEDQNQGSGRNTGKEKDRSPERPD